eukprot:TRINITY_DN783_c0_g1_i1.p1 TRINITY_DN783_c0_g1~~TRINITY_DN783_c0_g1_i1.p1  ORF type:complete len:270 (+),score=38.88 TRINITY_DN783_c0_g1_i1:110-919(+)
MKGLILLIILCDYCFSQAVPELFALEFTVHSINGSTNSGETFGQNLTTILDKQQITYFSDVVPKSKKAIWLSQLIGEAGSTWAESGNITFYLHNGLHFKSFGYSGNVLPGPNSGDSYGAITYSVNGVGSYAGYKGVMVDMFVSSSASPSTFPVSVVGVMVPPSQSSKLFSMMPDVNPEPSSSSWSTLLEKSRNVITQNIGLKQMNLVQFTLMIVTIPQGDGIYSGSTSSISLITKVSGDGLYFFPNPFPEGTVKATFSTQITTDTNNMQ